MSNNVSFYSFIKDINTLSDKKCKRKYERCEEVMYVSGEDCTKITFCFSFSQTRNVENSL